MTSCSRCHKSNIETVTCDLCLCSENCVSCSVSTEEGLVVCQECSIVCMECNGIFERTHVSICCICGQQRCGARLQSFDCCMAEVCSSLFCQIEFNRETGNDCNRCGETLCPACSDRALECSSCKQTTCYFCQVVCHTGICPGECLDCASKCLDCDVFECMCTKHSVLACHENSNQDVTHPCSECKCPHCNKSGNSRLIGAACDACCRSVSVEVDGLRTSSGDRGVTNIIREYLQIPKSASRKRKRS